MGPLEPKQEKERERNPFLDAVEADPELRARLDSGGRLDNAIWKARKTTPERWSVVLKLSREAGLPPEVVDDQFDAIVERYSQPSDPEKSRLLREYPRTAAFFSKRDNAAVALPDMEGFRRLDGAFQRLYGGLQPMTENQIKDARNAFESSVVPRLVEEQVSTRAGFGLYPGPFEIEAEKKRLADEFENGLRADEAFIAGRGEIGTIEQLTEMFRDNPAYPVPWFGAFGKLGKNKRLAEAALASKENRATWYQKHILNRAARIQEAARLRGQSTGAMIADITTNMFPYAVEFATGAPIQRGISGAITGLSREAAKSTVIRAFQNALTNRAVAFTAGVTAQAAATAPIRTLSGMYERMLINDEDLSAALPKAFLDEVIETGTEYAGGLLGFIEKPIGRKLANWFRLTNPGATGAGLLKFLKEAAIHGPGGEIFEEEAAKVLRDVTGIGPSYRPPTGQELLAQGLAFSLPWVAGFGLGKLSRRGAEEARSRSDLLVKVADEIASLKTNERSPEAVEEAVKTMTEGTPVENVFVSAEFWQDYWQKQTDEAGNKINPREQAARIIGMAVPYEQTLQAKADLQIPMSKYARYIAPEHGKAFASEVRVDPLEMNGREAEEFLKALDAEEKKAVEQNVEEGVVKGEPVPIQEGAKPSPESSALEVRRIITSALERAKVHPSVASRYAKLYETGFRTLGKRAGIDPLELFRRYNITVGREGFDTAPKAGEMTREQPAFRPSQAFTAPQAIERAKLLVGESEFTDRKAAVIERGVSEERADEATAREIIKERQYEQPKRGRIRVGTEEGKPISAAIDLFKAADLSTFLHESGHLYLTILEDLAKQNVAPDIVADYEAIRKWVGAKAGEELSIPQHEKFARGFEAYLMEGKAPTPELRDAFHRFKSWLLSIYKTAKELFVDLNPEIRGVFDRLLVSQEEIAAAQEQQQQKPMFAELQKDFDEAKMAAEAELDDKLRAEYAREREKWWNNARDKEREDAEKEVTALPVYKALRNLRAEKPPDYAGFSSLKLSTEIIKDQYSDVFQKTIPKDVQRKGGLHPDTVAQMVGFNSGEELLNAISQAENEAALIDRITDDRMKTKYGDLIEDYQLPDEAIKAVHNEKRAQLLRKELDFLAKHKLPTLKKGIRTVMRRPPPARVMQAVRELAETAVLERKITEIRPEIYRRAEARAAKDAQTAALKGDWEAAAEAKQRELLNYELHRAASDARENFVAGAEYLNKFTNRKALERIGKADYIEQITRLIGRFGILPESVVEEAERKSLASWIGEKEKNGESLGEKILISEKMLTEDFRQPLSDLTYEDFTGLVDAVNQIEHIAIAQEKMAASEKKERREDAKREILDSIGKAKPPRPPGGVTSHGAPLGERITKHLREADADLLKVERFMNWADEDRIDGPFHRFMFNPASEAQAAELDLHREVTAKVAQAVNSMPKELRSRLLDTIQVPGYEGGLRLTRLDALGIGLNAGNDSNWSKMVRGESMKKGGFTEDELHLILDQLTEDEWKFIVKTGKTLESLWPRIAQLQKELTGLEPEKVKLRPVQTRFGTFDGWYYPIMYDRHATAIGQRQEEEILDARIGDFQGRGYNVASLPSGYRKSRVEEFAAPLDYNIFKLPIQIAGELKDLTHRKWLIDQNWILSDREIRGAIIERFGPEYLDMLTDWVKRITNDRNITNRATMTKFDRIVEQFRANTIVGALGFKAASTFAQSAGVGPITDMIGLDYYRKGFQKVSSGPLKAFNEMKEKSGEMRHRVLTKDQNLRDEFRRLEGRTDPIADLKRFSMGGIVYGEAVITTPAWWGAYYKALDEGKSEKLAVHYADSVIRLTQGAAGAKDLAKVMTTPLMRLFTMFYTPGSALYSQIRDVVHATKSPADIPKAMLRLWWVVVVPAVISEITGGKLPKDDDDNGWFKWAAKTLAHYPASSLPFLRDAMSSILNDYDYQFTPLTQVGKTTVEAVRTGKKWVEGDAETGKLMRDLFRASGYWLGLPTGQLSITGEYMIDLAEGDVEPDSFPEFMHDLLYRRPKERNKD